MVPYCPSTEFSRTNSKDSSVVGPYVGACDRERLSDGRQEL